MPAIHVQPQSFYFLFVFFKAGTRGLVAAGTPIPAGQARIRRRMRRIYVLFYV